MSNLEAVYPALAHLFAAYVHQDYDLDGPSPDAAIRRFARAVAPLVRLAALGDLDRLLASAPDEPALDHALDALGCGYKPRGGASPARAWLAHVRTLLGPSPG